MPKTYKELPVIKPWINQPKVQFPLDFLQEKDIEIQMLRNRYTREKQEKVALAIMDLVLAMIIILFI